MNKIVHICSENIDIHEHFKTKLATHYTLEFCTLLDYEVISNEDAVILVDYDSVAHEMNTFFSENTIKALIIVLERVPSIATGKMLLRHNVRAYGNSMMHTNHLLQLVSYVLEGKVWTYPELTASLAHSQGRVAISRDAQTLMERLTDKELEVVYAILDGLTNQAIAQMLQVSVRTVKSHVSHIFSKLHVNDRLALVLLLKG